MFNYNDFMDRFKTWRKKPLFWVAMLFLWPFLLLGLLVLLGLWSIKDIKKNEANALGTKFAEHMDFFLLEYFYYQDLRRKTNPLTLKLIVSHHQ